MAISSARQSAEDAAWPGSTKTTIDRMSAILRGRYGAINTELRRSVQSADGLNLAEQLAADWSPPSAPDGYSFPSNENRQNEYLTWLDVAQRQGILDTYRQEGNRYIESTYKRGVKDADRLLRGRGNSPPSPAPDSLFSDAVHADHLEQLYTRSFEELQGVTTDVRQEFSREISRAYLEGLSPTETTKRLTSVVNDTGKTGVTRVVRTEFQHIHNVATAQRLESFGLKYVDVITGGNPCDQCASLADANPHPIKHATALVPDSTHPNCVCVLAPPINIPSEAADVNQLPVSHTELSEEIIDAPVPINKQMFDNYNSAELTDRAREANMSLEDYQEMLSAKYKELVSDSTVTVEVPEKVINDILADGRIKSQFESNISGGWYAPDERADIEKALFGYRNDMTPESRPIYGYLSEHNVEKPQVELYGDASIRLKPEVRDRTTMTIGDSYDATQIYIDSNTADMIPMPVNNPDYHVGSKYSARWVDDWDKASDVDDYIEAQIHGGITLDDIDVIEFRKEPKPATRIGLDGMKIPWRVMT